MAVDALCLRPLVRRTKARRRGAVRPVRRPGAAVEILRADPRGDLRLAALQHPERKRWFAGPSPWLAAAIAALVVAPHLWWLATHGAPPLRYLARVSGRGYGATARYAATAFFGALAQNAVAVAAALFVAGLGPVALAANARAKWREPRFRMLAILTAAPLLLTVAAALVLRNKVSTNMLIGTFPLAPLLASRRRARATSNDSLRLSLKLAAALSLAALVASPAVAVARAWISRDQNDVEPRQELAVAADSVLAQTTGKPLAYVGGTRFYDNGVAFYSADRPHGFVGFDEFRNRWVTPEKLAEGGLLSVCVTDDADCLAATAPFRTADSRTVEITLAHRLSATRPSRSRSSSRRSRRASGQNQALCARHQPLASSRAGPSADGTKRLDLAERNNGFRRSRRRSGRSQPVCCVNRWPLLPLGTLEEPREAVVGRAVLGARVS